MHSRFAFAMGRERREYANTNRESVDGRQLQTPAGQVEAQMGSVTPFRTNRLQKSLMYVI